MLYGETDPRAGFPNNYDEFIAEIDNLEVGRSSWHTFTIRYTGPIDDTSPSWKRQEYVVHTRDMREAYHGMLASRDFDGKFDYRPYKCFVKGKRTYSNLMSSLWAWNKAVRTSNLQSLVHSDFLQDEIGQDPQTHDAMLVPVILGADKTTVSVATGDNEFHPLYTSAGNIHSDVRRSHRDAVIPVAFLAIPKG